MGEEGGGNDELFGEQCRKDIGDILGVLNDERFDAFWNALRAECLKIRRGINTTPNSFKIAPFDATLTQRVKWLHTNVLRPVERLENALSNANQPHFRHWEEYGETDDVVTNSFLEELTQLKKRATSLAEWLEQEIDGETAGKIAHTNEIRSYIVFVAIDEARKHFPEVKQSRGNWDQELGTMVGRTPEYVRRVFLETTGRHELLDNKIEDFV